MDKKTIMLSGFFVFVLWIMCIFLMSCASQQREWYVRYPNIGLSISGLANKHLQDKCMRGDFPAHEWDNGTAIQPGQETRGCYDGKGNIFILKDNNGAKTLVHELAHFDGSLPRKIIADIGKEED